MKKAYLLIASAAMVLAACSDNSARTEIEEQEYVLGFSGVFIDNATKAITTGPYTTANIETVGNTMGVFGWKSVTTPSSSETKLFDDQEVEYTEVETVKDWRYSPLKYWDKNASKYSFYAYIPHSSDFTGTIAMAENDTTTFSITDFVQSSTVASQVDLLLDLTTKSNVTGVANYKSDVEFTFRHALSNVNIKMAVSKALKDDATDNPVAVKSVVLKNIKLQGTYSYNTTDKKFAWAISDASKSDFSSTANPVFASNTLVDTEFTGVPGMTNMLFVPQTVIDDYVLQITYTIGTGATPQEYYREVKLADFLLQGTEETSKEKLASWQPGYLYNYVITIGPDPILFDVNKVNNWVAGGTYTYTIE